MLLCMMITTGLKTTFAEIRSALAKPALIVRALVVNFLLVPATTMLLLYLFKANPLAEIGFIILAVCPGAPFGPVAANIAKGDVSLAAGLMGLLSVASVFIAPLLLYIIMYAFPELGALQIDYTLVIRGLVLFQLFPLVVALLFHQWRPFASKRIVRPVEIATNLLVMFMIVYGLSSQFNRIGELSLYAVTGMIILFLSSLAMGWASGEKNTASRKTMALTTAIRNTGIAMIIAIDNFPATIAVVVVILWGLIMMIMGLATIMLFKRIANKY